MSRSTSFGDGRPRMSVFAGLRRRSMYFQCLDQKPRTLPIRPWRYVIAGTVRVSQFSLVQVR